jgi:hypothetical protein
MPRVGGRIVVQLPGEVMQCEVVKFVDADRVVVEVSSEPMSRRHQYRKGDKIGARRRIDTLTGTDLWDALDDRDFIANRSPFEMKPVAAEVEPPKRKTSAKRKRK